MTEDQKQELANVGTTCEFACGVCGEKLSQDVYCGDPSADPATIHELHQLKDQLKDGTASDGYHTFNELYEYRMLYNAHAAHGWLAAGIPVVKSWRHSDGELCFGGGYFIVSAQLPTGQVSNHYKAQYWELFSVPEVELPPAYDGHTPADAAQRLRDALTLPAPSLGSEAGSSSEAGAP